MEDTFFSVEEAASVLGCKKTKVYQLLADGWLHGPPGRPRKDGRARVSKKSLFQLMVVDRLSLLPARTLRNMGSGRKNLGEIFSAIANANRFSIDEGKGKATEPSAPHSTRAQETSGQPHRCLHHDYAEQHQYSFGWRARQLARGDPAMQDDLVQEMSLAVDRKSTRLNSSHNSESRMPSSA
jgi:hypothetical protein